MPEGDTIWRAAAALRPRLVGKPVLEAWPERMRRLEGASVTAVEANGKHLLIRFDCGLVLHTHMRMTGSWHLYRQGERWLKPAGLARVVLKNADTVAVLFSAPVVELLRERELDLGHLGPDILAPEFDAQAVVARARRTDRRTLGETLLDQRVVAGIGNIYRCESLWRLGLDPMAELASVDDGQLRDAFEEARILMRAALTGRVSHAVHGRGGRPCRRCQGPIRVVNHGDPPRLLYYCPTCQQPGLR